MPLDINILGEGVYTPREVARLIGSTPQDVLRWTRGSGPNPPLWNAYYQPLDDTTELSFLDLIELRVVKALRAAGLSMQSIRFAINLAKERYGISRPLSTAGFRTDGAEILIDAIENDGEYLSLSKKNPGQKVFSKVVGQSLVDLEYDGDQVARWRPGFASGVVVDPKRYFGDPLLDDFGISTKVISDEFELTGSVQKLSDLYEIPEKAVRNAINFEEALEKP
ncbi:helix-turn-helix domain-containing protein [Jannaschia sp. S6380]|uniref:helix-turn-helix domain-containing protein n=1 Tax=Jannaschia sp. S6380 TaxID=2926408 RepID=UPI001FF1B600|nr:helix-turn-helix domain-containing protein [Jannaschia sp. S6380]MCK0168231.1 helix-turn-helix domain-containing protein [Jannaschia sp. S6380]